MTLQFVKHEHLWLRDLTNFSEKWLHNEIIKDTSILGLGDLDVISGEKIQFGGGRLDLLLCDSENGVRFEVEIMLGGTDPSHIIRCIEYWDIERRRYPAYDHVAVLVAEDITSRFLHVIGLLSGSIPIVAIQLNALKVGEQLVLDFIKVLDQRTLREDDEIDVVEDADRGTWEKRVGSEIMTLCDQVAKIANEIADPKVELKYLKARVALGPFGTFFIVAALFPKKTFLPIRVRLADSEQWLRKLEDAGMDVNSKKPGVVIVRIRPNEFSSQESLLRELLHAAVREFQT